MIDNLPELPGCIFTFDALHSIRLTMSKVVLEKDGDFLIQVKGNARQLKTTIERVLQKKKSQVQTAQTIDKGHGRIEIRTIEMVSTTPAETGWPHTHTICRVHRRREVMRGGKVVESSEETSLYVGSFSAARTSPQTAARVIRGHWSIENCLHHRKDRSMNEDRNRASTNGTGQVMCCIRSIAALVLGRTKETFKVVQRRLASKPNLLMGLLLSTHLDDWLNRFKPYKFR